MSNVDIAAPSVLRGVPKDVRDAVKSAALFGWTGRKRGQGGLILHSPDGVHSVTIPITVNRVNTAKQIARDIVRWTPDEVKARVTEEAIDKQHDESVVALATLVRDAAGSFPASVVSSLEPEDRPTVDLPDLETIEPAVTIVSVEPWMARVGSDGGKSDLYPSQATLERTWSDGSKDYMCSFCEEYTNDNPRAVSTHYGKAHTSKGQTPKADTTPTVFNAEIDGFRSKRVVHLAREIEAALLAVPVGSAIDDETWARALATHIVTERIAKGKEKAEDEPVLSGPDEILARIRTLLLRDEHKQVEVAQAESAALRAQMAEVVKSRDHFKDLADRRGSALTTFAALAAEESERE